MDLVVANVEIFRTFQYYDCEQVVGLNPRSFLNHKNIYMFTTGPWTRPHSNDGKEYFQYIELDEYTLLEAENIFYEFNYVIGNKYYCAKRPDWSLISSSGYRFINPSNLLVT